MLAACLAPRVGAQIPTPPDRFYGTVRVNGAVPSDGTPVTAFVGPFACGRTETAGGSYRLDVLAATMRPGCGVDGQPIHFQVGDAPADQTASWRGATFTRLDLTARAPAYDMAALDLDSPCIPAQGSSGCDPARLRLWNGDQEAWTLLYRALGAPPPTPDQVFDEVLKLRLEAGDPALTAIVARNLGWPYLKITAIRFRGTAPDEPDEFSEVTNLGGAPQTMTGWHLRVAGSAADFRFQQDSVLAPGQSCRVYTNERHPDSCPGFGFGSTSGLWDDAAGSALLTVDYPALIADRTRYVADPTAQPPAPALQGRAIPR